MTSEFGILVYDIKLEHAGPDIKVVNNTILVNHNDREAFIDVIAWDNNAEILDTYFKKGQLIYLDGHLINVTRIKDNVEFTSVAIQIDDIKFPYLDSKEIVNIQQESIDEEEVPSFL